MTDYSSIILIGGAPCAGKSTVAKSLAKQLGCQWVSTDNLREEFRGRSRHPPYRYPWLHATIHTTAEKWWADKSAADLLQVEIGQAKEMWPMIRHTIRTSQAGIFEGLSLLPELIHQAFGSSIRAVYLIDNDLARIRKTIFMRGLWDEAKTYADWVKEKEINSVSYMNDWIKSESRKYALPLVNVGDQSTLTQRVALALGIHNQPTYHL